MYYINSFFLYSLFGFIMESDVYKISNSVRHSSIFYGPVTTVYGFGVLSLIILDKLFLSKINCNKYFKIILTFVLCMIILSVIEFLGGNILHMLFNIDMWNYSNKPIHFGKYLCLDLCLLWGVFGVLYLYVIRKYTDKIVNVIPKSGSILFCIIFLVDLLMVLINK